MKINPNFQLRTVAGKSLVIALGADAVEFNSLLTLNETGAFLWKLLENSPTEASLVSALTEEYNVSEEDAKRDLAVFLEQLRSRAMLQE